MLKIRVIEGSFGHRIDTRVNATPR